MIVALMLGAFAALAARALPAGETVRLAPVSSLGRREALIIGASAFIGVWGLAVHPGAEGVIAALLGVWLLLLAVLDLEHFWLPLKLTAPLGLVGLIVSIGGGAPSLFSAIIGAAAGYLAFYAVAGLYRQVRGRAGLGLGDAWLAAAAGAWCGWQGLPWVVLLGALGGLAQIAATMILRREVDTERPVPFGVWLAGAFWLVWLYGAPF